LAPITNLIASWCSTELDFIFLITFIFGFTRPNPRRPLHPTTRIVPFSAKASTRRAINIGFRWSARSWPRWPTLLVY
jgi:hypothetical protein